ncbi:hypothetical protein NDU88_001494 [Pleurodeles waltl]|uniref:Uncharacterized protein n=1 Tax=Pleurodeles waltl TaxID=8319 RepID=A0AAV7WPH7_PLEWA|nr:hypothetical protein NDU88_001494 [Pleurodeles waltl]
MEKLVRPDWRVSFKPANQGAPWQVNVGGGGLRTNSRTSSYAHPPAPEEQGVAAARRIGQSKAAGRTEQRGQARLYNYQGRS